MSRHTLTETVPLGTWQQRSPLFRRAWQPQPKSAPPEPTTLEAALLQKNRLNIRLAAGKHVPLAEIAAADAALAAACEARAGL